MANEADLEQLIEENRALKEELAGYRAAEERSKKAKKAGFHFLGTVVFRLLDRKKILTNSRLLFRSLTRFTQPNKEDWPKREELLNESEELLASIVRFLTRRRLFTLLLSLVAMVIPGIQIWLAFQQNRIVENQNAYYEVQVYDILARALTGDDINAKQVTGALMARTDIDLLGGIIDEVFSADMGVAFTAQDLEARERRLKDAAFRGHLLLGLSRAALVKHENMSLKELNSKLFPLFSKVISDATWRVPELLRLGPSKDPQLTEEVFRYLSNLGNLLRTQWSIAHRVGYEKQYFAVISPFINRVSRQIGTSNSFHTVFYQYAMRELLVDLALKPNFEDQDAIGSQTTEEITAIINEGLQILQTNTTENSKNSWAEFKKQVGNF